MDAAFATCKYPAYTLDQLRSFVAEGRPPAVEAVMKSEIARREAVAAGDVSQMTPGERLRFVREHNDDVAEDDDAYDDETEYRPLTGQDAIEAGWDHARDHRKNWVA